MMMLLLLPLLSVVFVVAVVSGAGGLVVHPSFWPSAVREQALAEVGERLLRSLDACPRA